MRSPLLLLCAVYLCVASAAVFKNLAGEPSEFGNYVLPTPSMSAQVENSAAYYIHYEAASKSKVKASQTLYVDSTTQFDFSLFTPILDSITVTLIDPNGKRISVAQHANPTYFPIGDDAVNGTNYMFQNPLVGKYQLLLESSKLDKATYDRIMDNDQADGYILMSNDNSIQSHTILATYQLFTGSKVGVLTRAYNTESFSVSDMRKGLVPKGLDGAESASMVIVYPNGTRAARPMQDDGLNMDEGENDKVFGALFTAPVEGQYVIQATVKGTTPEGVEYVRTTEQLVPVVDRAATLSGYATGSIVDSGDVLYVNIVTNPNSQLQQYRAYAEVWGKDSNGNDLAICWIGGMTMAQQDQDGTVFVPLNLNMNWISRVNAVEPFTLKNVILQDPDTFIPYDTSDEMPLKTIGNLQAAMTSLSGKLLTTVNAFITEEMRMGKRPDAYKIQTSNNVSADSAPVILVHGYCVEVNPFTAVATQFTNAKIFLNTKANLVNDAFAKKVVDWAGTGPYSYIAHSQGGLVGVHILEFYWSGMDQVSGGRLVQSIGSPYQGSSAAGSAADLGGLFGVGCGGTKDLTRDGATLWLATVGTISRNKVYYYTTTADSCNFATNLVLKKPNDGMAEETYSQLIGGANMGNKAGWCHSVGMKSPAQTQDAARNAEMNAQAARTPITSTF